MQEKLEKVVFNITQEAYAFIVKELTEPHTQKKGKKDSWETFSRVSVRNTVCLIDFVCVHTNNQNRWDPTSLSLHHTGPAETEMPRGRGAKGRGAKGIITQAVPKS